MHEVLILTYSYLSLRILTHYENKYQTDLLRLVDVKLMGIFPLRLFCLACAKSRRNHLEAQPVDVNLKMVNGK